MTIRVDSCSHPEWLGPNKPAPCDVTQCCGCGANWQCPKCGYGAGQSPCDCTRTTVVPGSPQGFW